MMQRTWLAWGNTASREASSHTNLQSYICPHSNHWSPREFSSKLSISEVLNHQPWAAAIQFWVLCKAFLLQTLSVPAGTTKFYYTFTEPIFENFPIKPSLGTFPKGEAHQHSKHKGAWISVFKLDKRIKRNSKQSITNLYHGLPIPTTRSHSKAPVAHLKLFQLQVDWFSR